MSASVVAIVGKGPSLARLTRDHFRYDTYLDSDLDSVIALNQAIVKVRETFIGNIYTMQKDGCETHANIDYPGNQLPPGHVCRPASDMIPPDGYETLIVSKHESPNCFSEWRHRIVLDPEPWYQPSIVMATNFAIHDLQAYQVDFYCMDSYTRDDYGTWLPTGNQAFPYSEGYLRSAEQAARICAREGVAMRWVTP